MDVVLHVYDLSKGLARNLSLSLIGTQIDAIYHTSIVFGGVEYFFGRGIQQAVPGATHHGTPIEKLNLGRTELPFEVIIEYMESLAETYTEDSYDLFLRNCNNFTHDLAMFLVGKGIPDHIRNLPETFLNTPFGQMMKPYIDGMLRGVTQGPEVQPSTNPGAAPTTSGTQPLPPHDYRNVRPKGKVHNVIALREIDSLLSAAKSSCAVIFFTSATCPPCKILYPAYDQLAEEAGDKAILIKVDISRALDVSSKYDVRATPTFMTFLNGEKENEWSGANEGELLGNVRLLTQMAWPPHPHTKLKLPSLQRVITGYVTYRKSPPLDKLAQKLGPAAKDPALDDLMKFIKAENSSDAGNPPLPDMKALAGYVHQRFPSLPVDLHFAVVDLFRLAFADSRVSGYFARESDHRTLMTLLNQAKGLDRCSYGLQLVMTQLTCNLFTSPLYRDQVIQHEGLRAVCIKLASASILDKHTILRVAAASLAYNLAVLNHNERIEERPDVLSEAEQVELIASLLEAIRLESESQVDLRGLLLALGLLVHLAPLDGEVVDLCRAMEAASMVIGKSKIEVFKQEPLVKEIGLELLQKGLKS